MEQRGTGESTGRPAQEATSSLGSFRRVGRDHEIALLRRVVLGAVEGSGGSILIEGEAGIGKTLLVEETLSDGSGRSFLSVIGTQDPIGTNRPLGVLIDAVSDLAVVIGDSPISASVEGGEMATHDALIDVVQRTAARRPLVIAIENLHWTDDATTQALCRLVRLAPQLSLGLILTTRPFGADERLHHLSSVVAGTGGAHHRLGPLDHQQVIEIGTQHLGAIPGSGLQRRLRATGGNPLLTLELLQGLEDHGALTESDGTVELGREIGSPPIGLTILRRLSILPATSLEVIRSAAILGRTFTLGDLRLIVDLPNESLTAAVEDAITARVLAAAGAQLRFRHDLVWELLYEDLAAPVRATRHLDVAAALSGAGRPAEDVVDHLLLAITSPDNDTLVLVTSVVESLLARSPGVARKLTERARSVWDVDTDETALLRAQHAMALLATGDHTQGRDESLALLSSGIGQPLRGRIREALLASLTMTGRLDETIEICEAALASSSIDETERANIASSLAFAKLHAGQLDESIDLADFAATATPSFEPSTAARAHTIKAHALSHLGRFSECVDVALAAIADLEERGANVLHFAHAIAGSRMMMLDRFEDGHAVLERGRQLYERHGSVAALCQYHVSKGFGHFVHGEWDDAVAEFTATNDLADDGLAWPVLSHGTLALIAAQRGTPDVAQQHLDVVDEVLAAGGAPLRVDLSQHARALLVETSTNDGKDDRVAELSRQEWDALTAGTPLISSLGFTPQIADNLMRAGDERTARAVADALDSCASVNPTAPSIVGAARLTEGIVDHKVEPMLQALEAYERSGHVLARTFAHRRVAEALIEAGDVDPARPLLSAARDLCDSVGAVAEAELVDRVAQQAGVDSPAPPTQPAASGWDSLTATERTVVEFLGRRLSNPEIAEAMYISRRTVESHVSSILAKLGVRSRIDVARQMEDSGFLTRR